MSLADELQAAYEASNIFTTAEWMTRWIDSLDDTDKAAVDDCIADPKKGAALFRVVRKHGYPRSSKAFREWLSRQRDHR